MRNTEKNFVSGLVNSKADHKTLNEPQGILEKKPKEIVSIFTIKHTGMPVTYNYITYEVGQDTFSPDKLDLG